ncbi:MAG: hypothetical protein L0229_11730 [Blastocatellia bacterium]|nr:hypothetical protein [Blastocatellia bacterium]
MRSLKTFTGIVLCSSRRVRFALSLRPVFYRVSAVCLALLSLTWLAGCGGKPFKVKPRPDVPEAQIRAGARAESNGVALLAEAVTDEDFLYETFDANLILAGVLPVRVKLTNNGEDPVDLRKARFEIRNSSGRRFKGIDPEDAFKRLISYYGVSIYSKPGYKESRQDFSSYAFELESPLGPGESRQGMIFFRVPGDVAREPGLTLFARRLDSRQSKSDAGIELKLN